MTKQVVLCGIAAIAGLVFAGGLRHLRRRHRTVRWQWPLPGFQDSIIRLRETIHQNPELGNREFKTAELVANHLRNLGFDEVSVGVAHTGVVGVLRGGRPGPVVAVRADMDALPVTEDTPFPFKSTVRTTYLGQDGAFPMRAGTISTLRCSSA